jgi:hypothetical protein
MQVRPVGGGIVRIAIQMRADEAAELVAAIDAARVPAETRLGESHFSSRVDALLAVVRGTDPPRPELTVEVGPNVLDDDWSARLEDGSRVPAETLRRLACDCGIVPVVTDDTGKTLDVGRKTRSIPAAIRRALRRRDCGCRFPGCSNEAWIEGHHIRPWLHGGETKLDALISLCRKHHRLVHEGGWTVEACGEDFLFRNPSGIAATPPTIDDGPTALAAHNSSTGLSITHQTNRPAWNGLTPDYPMCAAALSYSPASNQAPDVTH